MAHSDTVTGQTRVYVDSDTESFTEFWITDKLDKDHSLCCTEFDKEDQRNYLGKVTVLSVDGS